MAKVSKKVKARRKYVKPVMRRRSMFLSLLNHRLLDQCSGLHEALERESGVNLGRLYAMDRMLRQALLNYRASMRRVHKKQGMDWRSSVQDYQRWIDKRRNSGLIQNRPKPEAKVTGYRQVDSFGPS